MRTPRIDDVVHALLTLIALVFLPPMLALSLPLAVMYALASRGSRSDAAPTSCPRTRRGEDTDSSARTPAVVIRTPLRFRLCREHADELDGFLKEPSKRPKGKPCRKPRS